MRICLLVKIAQGAGRRSWEMILPQRPFQMTAKINQRCDDNSHTPVP
jgi:hypothetical protein